jgi:NAD(P)-dependent dehydrogenase (short-subunit alcohol dehydrogenase family)
MPVVVITGCSSGIGLATAVTFAGQGWDVVATMRDLARATSLQGALDSAGLRADIRRIDVVDDESVTGTMHAIVERYGRLDAVINNAGWYADGTLEELTVEDFRASLDVNLLGAVRIAKAAMPVMRAAGSGRIIGISSVSGVFGQPFNDAYCASKFALEGLFEALHPVAIEFGVHVSLIEAGPVDNGFMNRHHAPDGASDVGQDARYSALRARYRATQAGGYTMAQTDDEIAAVVYDVATADRPVLRYQTSELVLKMVANKLKDLTGERVTRSTRAWVTGLS